MAVSRTPAPADYGPAAPAVDRLLVGHRVHRRPSHSPIGRCVRVIRHARCAGSGLDPDQWFPVSAEMGKARQEAAAAITVRTTCMVRAERLALALRHPDIGQHGVRGGLVAAERAAWHAVGTRPRSARPRRAPLAERSAR